MAIGYFDFGDFVVLLIGKFVVGDFGFGENDVIRFNTNLNSRCDDIDATVISLKEEIRELKLSHDEELNLLKDKCAELDFKTKTEIYIHGYDNASIPDLDCTSDVINIAKFLDVPITDRDIASTRIVKRRGSPARTYASISTSKRPPIIAIDFFSHSTAAKIVDAKKRHGKLTNKDLDQSLSSSPISISFPLSRDQYSLLCLTKARAILHNVRFVWNSRGHVFTRQAEGAPAIKIRNEAHLDQLLPPAAPTSPAHMDTSEPQEH